MYSVPSKGQRRARAFIRPIDGLPSPPTCLVMYLGGQRCVLDGALPLLWDVVTKDGGRGGLGVYVCFRRVRISLGSGGVSLTKPAYNQYPAVILF